MSEIPPPELHVSKQVAHACISLPSSCLLSVRFSFICLPPVALVVTCRLPQLTGGRCHAAPGVLSSVPMFVGFPPPTCAAGGTWLGCRWRVLGDDAPPMVLWSSMRLAIPTRSIFRALDTPRSSWCSSLSAPPPPLPLSLYNRTCPNTLPTNGRVFLWLSC